MGKPTIPNRTNKATAADIVMTPKHTAKWIVDYFQPSGICLDPCAGNNSFYDILPNPKYRCEITDGLDFFDFDRKVDWIITNPPYSIYDRFLEHSFELATDVVLFVPIAKAFKSMKIERLVLNFGGLKELIFMGGGSQYGFSFGFPVGCLHYKKGYKEGICKITHKIKCSFSLPVKKTRFQI